MKVIGKDRTSCDVCNPIDEILARLDALERRASAIVAKVQGITPDGEGNVTLPTSSSDTDPLHGRIDAFAMSSEVKEAADDAHAYAASIADDVVVLQSDVENLTREVEALDPASVTALEQSVAALQQTVNQLSNLVGGISAVIRDLEDQMPNKVDRTGDTMTGPLNVVDTVTGSRNMQAVNGNRLQNDLDNYAPMIRTTGSQTKAGPLELTNPLTRSDVSGGRTAFNIIGTSGNCYVFTVRDSNDKSRGSMNHQTIMSGNRATRNTVTVQSDDYSTTDQTGAVGTFTLEVLPSGQLKVTAAVATGDGRKASQTIATLQAV